MPFADRLIHTIAIERPFVQLDDDDLWEYDDLNQPIREFVSITEEVRGLVQPKRASEIRLVSQAGAQISLYRAFFPIDTDLNGADRFHEVDSGDAYEIDGIEPHRYGSTPHFEVDCTLITSFEAEAEEPGS